jgi:hypothetical protein
MQKENKSAARDLVESEAVRTCVWMRRRSRGKQRTLSKAGKKRREE